MLSTTPWWSSCRDGVWDGGHDDNLQHVAFHHRLRVAGGDGDDGGVCSPVALEHDGGVVAKHTYVVDAAKMPTRC